MLHHINEFFINKLANNIFHQKSSLGGGYLLS